MKRIFYAEETTQEDPEVTTPTAPVQQMHSERRQKMTRRWRVRKKPESQEEARSGGTVKAISKTCGA